MRYPGRYSMLSESLAGTSEITTFANGLSRDCPSIENAISLPWSNGSVEGNVNKLKTIKRQMYCRASFGIT